MSYTFRGFDKSLIARVSNARHGARNYLDTDTLRYFDAYGGEHAMIDDDTIAVIESVRFRSAYHDDGPRKYRVTVFRFTRPWENDNECVTVERVTEDDTRAITDRLFREYVRDARATVSV